MRKTPRAKPKMRRLGGNNSQPEYRDKAFRELTAQIGGRTGLKEVATWNSDDSRAARLLEILDDPTYDLMGVKKVCAEVGIAYPDLVLMFREMVMKKGLLGMFGHIPNILEDAAIEAQSGIAPCPKCDGAKVVSDKAGQTLVCPRCQGIGQVRTKADKDARNFVGEVAGMIGKSPLVQINQDNRRQTALIGASSGQMLEFEDMIARSKPWERTLPAANQLPAAQPSRLPTDIIEGELVDGPVRQDSEFKRTGTQGNQPAVGENWELAGTSDDPE